MLRTLLVLVLVLVGMTTGALAEALSPSPYAGQERRAIKALSDEEIRDLTEGRGMGLARPAELNGYPGPLHSLELAEALGLNEARQTLEREA